MQSFARVAVNVPSLAGVFVPAKVGAGSSQGGAFDYAVPEELAVGMQPGQLVLVPFGKQQVQGVILSTPEAPAVKETRQLISIVDSRPAMTGQQLKLIEWMSKATLAPVSDLVSLFLPPGLEQQADTLYQVQDPQPIQPTIARKSELAPVARRLLSLLTARGALRGRQIDRALSRVQWRKVASQLVQKGRLVSQPVLPPPSVRSKSIRTAQLAVPPQVAEQAMDSIGSTDATRTRRGKALRYLIAHPQPVNVSWVYAESGCTLPDLQFLSEQELIVLRQQEIWRDPLKRRSSANAVGRDSSTDSEVELTREQQAAWQIISGAQASASAGRAPRPILIQGVTGSGKTELYIRAAAAALSEGKRAIVLVPEIALTPQTVERFVQRFPGQVGILHSRLSDGERYDTWRRARAGALKIIIGPRSALFAPLGDVGLVVLDECHDASYHQSEPPFYDAVETATEYSRICRCVCLLGSATPSVVQRHHGDTGEYELVELSRRIASHAAATPAPEIELPRVEIVDLREELRQGNTGIFSRPLHRALADTLGSGQQAILFLNRRGSATYVFCRNCGYVARCPRCETPLTYHTTQGDALRCHRCGYQRKPLVKCPDCGSDQIRAYGLGTERVESELQKLFPKASTIRWDWETTREKDAHEIILHHFAAGHADVLIGTQMLAKGLDLPRVTLVGIVMADVGLFLPDPFAAERTFQVLTQVAGRAGRSSIGGRVILQTYAPENTTIAAAARHDVDGFYQSELQERMRLGYPPFTRLLRLEYRHQDAASAQQTAEEAATHLGQALGAEAVERGAMIGPVPCFFSKIDGRYRWQIIIRGSTFQDLLAPSIFREWRIEADPVTLL